MPVPYQTVLSGSTNGKPIAVVATTTPGTNLHTAGASGYERVWLWASNITAAPATLTVEWGGVTDPGDHLIKGYSIPANSGPVPIAVGQLIQTALSIKAFSGTASAINITGHALAVR